MKRKATYLTLAISAVVAASSSHVLANGGGSTAGAPAEVERAGGMDSAGKDPKNPAASAGSALEALSLNAAPDYNDRMNDLEDRSGVVQTRVTTAKAQITAGREAADLLQTRAADALLDAQTMSVAADGALTSAAVAWNDANSARTAANNVGTVATNARDSANVAAYYANSHKAYNNSLASENAITATALSNANSVITDATGYIATQDSKTALEEELTQTVIAETALVIAQAEAAEAEANNAAALAGQAKTDADTAYARSVDAMQLAQEALSYVPKHASGVGRKSGGTKQVVDSEFTTLGGMYYSSHGGSGGTGVAVAREETANFKSSITFIASVFKSNYTVNNMAWSDGSGKNARLIVNSVEVGSGAVPTTAGEALSFPNVSIGYGDTVTIEYDAGVSGGRVTSDAVILCDTAAGATCTRS